MTNQTNDGRQDKLETRLDDLSARVRSLEQETGENRAMRKERDLRLFTKIEDLEKTISEVKEQLQKQISKVEMHLIWPLRIVGAAILAAIVTFIVNGGLTGTV